MDLTASRGKILRFTVLGILSSLFAFGLPHKKIGNFFSRSGKNLYYRNSVGYGVADEPSERKAPIEPAAITEKKEVGAEVKAQYEQLNRWFQDNGGCKVEFLVRYKEDKRLLLDLEDISGKQDYDLFQKEVNGKSKFEIFISHLNNEFEGYVENDEWTLNYKETVIRTCKDYKKKGKTILFFWREAPINPRNKQSFWQIFFDEKENNETYPYSVAKPRSIFSSWFSFGGR